MEFFSRLWSPRKTRCMSQAQAAQSKASDAANKSHPNPQLKPPQNFQPPKREYESEYDEDKLAMPGAFPSSRSPSPTPSSQPAKSERTDNDLPISEFGRMDIESMDVDLSSIPQLRTDLGSHLHPRPVRPRAPTSKTSRMTSTPPKSETSTTNYNTASSQSMLIQDPWDERSRLYENNPFGRPVSAVRLFTPKKSLPKGRVTSIYTKEWETRKKQKISIEDELGRPGRIVLTGEAVRPLSKEWAHTIARAMRANKAVAKSLAGDDLTARDIATCVRPLEWLNDEIINSYLDVIVQYLREAADNTGPAVTPRFHAFNTFFYSTLRQKGYDGVRRWAKRAKINGEGLLGVDMVFVPVHESSHWTLMVVRPADRTIEYFDSLGSRGARQVGVIKEWLRGELGSKFVEDEWSILPSVSSQQDNGSDCGVFLLTNAKAVALNIEPTAFGARDTTTLRQKIIAEIMNGGLHGEFNPADAAGNVLL